MDPTNIWGTRRVPIFSKSENTMKFLFWNKTLQGSMKFYSFPGRLVRMIFLLPWSRHQRSEIDAHYCLSFWHSETSKIAEVPLMEWTWIHWPVRWLRMPTPHMMTLGDFCIGWLAGQLVGLGDFVAAFEIFPISLEYLSSHTYLLL